MNTNIPHDVPHLQQSNYDNDRKKTIKIITTTAAMKPVLSGSHNQQQRHRVNFSKRAALTFSEDFSLPQLRCT